MPRLRAAGDNLAEAAEPFAHGLADRLPRLELRATPGDVDEQAAGRAVIDHEQDEHLAIPEGRRRPDLVGSPARLLARA